MYQDGFECRWDCSRLEGGDNAPGPDHGRHVATPRWTGDAGEWVSMQRFFEVQTQLNTLSVRTLALRATEMYDIDSCRFIQFFANSRPAQVKDQIGESDADHPAAPMIYDPAAPAGSRFSSEGLMASKIPRMYHSTATLTPDGTVMLGAPV
jgi:hypothetical protein